jgi:RNA polymerase sigma factor (sigma-70 family)
MTARSFAGAVSRLRASVLPAPAGDAELLDRFVCDRDERAFEALVRRHGPMVLAVCRRVLRNEQDAEDAFQATFLVLARKAGSVNPRGALAGWLHGVAHNVSRKARCRVARRAAVEAAAPPRSAELVPTEPNWDELEPVLDAELAALPEKYRAALVLCDLEGRTRAETATALGCSEGTLSSRLTRGRRMLAERLTRRGFRCTAGALAALLAGRTAALAESLVRATLPLASLATGAVPVAVSQLAHGVMKTMLMQKLRTVALAALVVAASAAALVTTAVPTSAAPLAPVPAAPAGDDTPATLADLNGRLLLNRKVLRDIKCDIDQLDKIMDAIEAAERKSQERLNAVFGGANPVANPMALEQMVKDAQKAGEAEMRKATAAVVKDHLTAPQRKRLAQIDLQARGYAALATPAVAKVLGLTEAQKEQLAESEKKVATEVGEAIQPPAVGNGAVLVNFDPEKALRKAQADATKRSLALLTDEQRKVWKEMTGAPVAFELPVNGHGLLGDIGFGGGFAVPAIPVPAPVVQPANPNG